MRTCATCVLLLWVGVTAAADEPLVPVDIGRAPGSGYGNLYLIGQQAVQQDLRLSAEQLAQVRALLRELVDRQDEYARVKDPTRRKQLGDEAVQMRLRHDKAVLGLLMPGQAQRLRQIGLHYKGTASFWDAEVRTTLAITDEQFQKMQALGRESYSEWNREVEATYRQDKDFAAYQKRLAENRQRRDREQAGVLTAAQQAAWKRMLGDPFAGPIPSPILLPAVARAPAKAAAERADTVDQLTRTIQALAQEIKELHQENRRLREDLERLRHQAAPAKAGASGRFRDHGEYVEDTQTGLLWQKAGTASGRLNYYDAIKYATSLNLGGHAGWRLPTRAELKAIFPATEPPFTDTKYNTEPYRPGPGEWANYWTADLDTRRPDYAYVYHWYAAGGANNCIASKNLAYVRCVREPIKK